MSFIKEAICRVVSEGRLPIDEAFLAMKEIMEGRTTESQIAAFLTALRTKGETVEELEAFARAMREHSIHIAPRTQSNLTDTCGTGGDGVKTFNVSTISAFVVSGAGIPVAKHGNRSFTSKCGSADLLERLGVNINATPYVVQNSIEHVGMGFMFAPVFHPAMKYASNVRKEIGIRTVFNVLGPLANPAGANYQLVGVYEDAIVRKMALVLKKLGAKHAAVVHGLDGLDEVSPIGKTHIAELHENDEVIRERILTPFESFGLEQRKYEEIVAPQDIEQHAMMAIRILSGDSNDSREKAVRDMILINASVAIVVSEGSSNYLEGVEIARESVRSGKAMQKLELLVKYSGGDASVLESLLARG